jgi:hypothetical protein
MFHAVVVHGCGSMCLLRNNTFTERLTYGSVVGAVTREFIGAM